MGQIFNRTQQKKSSKENIHRITAISDRQPLNTVTWVGNVPILQEAQVCFCSIKTEYYSGILVIQLLLKIRKMRTYDKAEA